MKHHFGDFLDRTEDYWTTIPNRERFAFIADFEIANKDDVKILTISKHQKQEHWTQVFDCINLEELTLHNPSKEQIQAIRKLTKLKRIRITFFRANDIEFLGELTNLEEVILEYVSGFSDLNPLQKLTKLKSLHLENLRKVSNFDGLKGINSLRYLYIDGTLDWKQPIENFSFLEGLPNLEIIAFRFVINKTEFPAFLPILKLRKLKRVRIGYATFQTKEYAFLQTALPDKCGDFGDNSWTVCYQLIDDYTDFIGKGAGRVKQNSPNSNERIEDFKRQYEEYKEEAEQIITNYCC
jgi:Leucine-rich repeat (LRR) protein